MNYHFEFAEFIADISDPGTGDIRVERLARWLDVTEKDLLGEWKASGVLAWRDYSIQVLAVLDAVQDLTLCLSQSLECYRRDPFVAGIQGSLAALVAHGRTDEALRLIRSLRGKGPGRPEIPREVLNKDAGARL